MALDYNFNECPTKGTSCKASIWSYRFNTTLKDSGKEFWYRDKLDFTRSDTSPSISISADEVVNDGDPRAKDKVTGFKENQDFSINESCNSSFLQRLHEIWSQADDNQRKDFLARGLDIKKETFFGDGSYTEEMWECCPLSAFEPPYRKQEGDEVTTDFGVTFNNEPVVKNIGFTSQLPSNVKPVTADITISSDTALTIDIVLANIVDTDNLIFNDELNVMIYDEDGVLVSDTDYDTSDTQITSLVTEAGKYTVIVSYILFKDTENKYLKALEIKEVEVNAV